METTPADHQPLDPESPTRDGTPEALDDRTGDRLSQAEAKALTKARRLGRPRGSKNVAELTRPEKIRLGTKRVIEQWLGLRALYPGMSTKEIAIQMGMTADGLYKAIRRAQDQGILEIHEPLEKLKYEVIPRAVENLNQLLKDKDKTATLETMKGTLFKSFQASEGITEQPNMVLGIKIDMTGADEAKLATGQIMGKPRLALPDDPHEP